MSLGCSALPFISIIQKCLHPLIVFEFCYSLHLCITSRRVTKKYYAITKEERSSPIIVKFAVIKPRGGFKPRFCHTRLSNVCPSWFSASNVTRLHCYITMLNVRVKRAATMMTSFLLNHRDKANTENRTQQVANRIYSHLRPSYLFQMFA